jgi:LemA protein
MTRARTILVALALGPILGGCGYNRIQELDERTDQLEADVETELVRRNDLIPNLVATVEEAARFEQETFTEVARARSGLSESRDRLADALEGEAEPGDLDEAARAVSDNLRLFLNVAVEAYPQLTANQSFIRLQDELAETENRIAVARRDYNEGVAEYNTYIRRFPAVITAKVIGADRKEPYEAPEGAETPPEVDFGGDTG